MADQEQRPAARERVAEAPLPPILIPAILLTFGDAALTLTWLERGVAVEANPLLAGMIEAVGPHLTLGLRAVVGALLLLALGALTRRSRMARLALPVVTAALAVVLVWHIGGGLMVLL